MKYDILPTLRLGNYNSRIILMFQNESISNNNHGEVTIYSLSRDNAVEISKISISGFHFCSIIKSSTGLFFGTFNNERKYLVYHIDYSLNLKKIEYSGTGFVRGLDNGLILGLDRNSKKFVVSKKGKIVSSFSYEGNERERLFESGMIKYSDSPSDRITIFYYDYNSGKEVLQYKGLDRIGDSIQIESTLIITWIEDWKKKHSEPKENYICAIDIHSGQEIWKSYEIPGTRLAKGPNDELIIQGRETINFYDSTTGKQLKVYNAGGNLEYNTYIHTIENGKIYINNCGSRRACLDMEKDSIDWEIEPLKYIIKEGGIRNIIPLNNGEILGVSDTPYIVFKFDPHHPDNVATSYRYNGKLMQDK